MCTCRSALRHVAERRPAGRAAAASRRAVSIAAGGQRHRLRDQGEWAKAVLHRDRGGAGWRVEACTAKRSGSSASPVACTRAVEAVVGVHPGRCRRLRRARRCPARHPRRDAAALLVANVERQPRRSAASVRRLFAATGSARRRHILHDEAGVAVLLADVGDALAVGRPARVAPVELAEGQRQRRARRRGVVSHNWCHCRPW